MGGFYNMVFEAKPYAPALLALLKAADPEVDFGRERDAWVEIQGDWIGIRVHTRNGGTNRASQKPAIDSMRAHPWFDRDADQEFDSTYADFWFVPPHQLGLPGEFVEHHDEILEFLTRIAVPPVDMNERWREAIAKLSTEGPPPSMDPLVQQLKQAVESFGAGEGPDAPTDASSG